MKETKTLRMDFTDEGSNKIDFRIANPIAGITSAQTVPVGEFISSNKILLGKTGKVNAYVGAVLITRTETVL